MPKKHNKSKRSKKNKRKEKSAQQIESISSESQSEEDNPQPGTSKAFGPQSAESPEPSSSDEELRPYEEAEPRVPLIPGVGLPGRAYQEPKPQPGPSGLCRRTTGRRSRRREKRTKSLEHTPPKSEPSSRSHSTGSSGNGAEADKQSLFNEAMTYDDVIEIMYRKFRGDGYVRPAALFRVTFETKRTIEEILQLINARVPEEKDKEEKDEQ